MTNQPPTYEWRRFFAALGATVVVLTLLVVLFFATLGRGGEEGTIASGSTSTTSEQVGLTYAERNYLRELRVTHIFDRSHTDDQLLEMGYDICYMLDRMGGDPKSVYDYLYDYQMGPSYDGPQTSYSDLADTVYVADIFLCSQ